MTDLLPVFPIFKNPALAHYGFELAAFFIGIQLYYVRKQKIVDPISDDHRLWILIGAMLGAFIGSRAIAILENPQTMAQLSWLEMYGSKTVAGGLLGGLFGVELIKKKLKVQVASGDVYVVPIIAALLIGRIGCFLSGLAEPTYGLATTFFTGINLGDGIRRHPVSLYEMAYLVLLLMVFRRIRKIILPNGDRFKLFMVLYFAYRFFIEFLKPYHPLFLQMSSIHLSALFIFIYYHRFIGRCLNRFLT